MKSVRRLWGLWIAILAACGAQAYGQAGGIAVQPPQPPRTDATAARIIALHLQAIGGAERMAALQSLRRTARQSQGGTDSRLTFLHAFPFHFHWIEQRTHLGWDYRTDQLYTGVHAWQRELLPKASAAQPLDTGVAKVLAFEANLPVLFVNYARKGYAFSYVGETEFAGTPVLLVRGHLFPGFSVDIFFDKARFFVVNYRYVQPFAGAQMQVDRMPTGMRKIDGIWFTTGYDFRVEGQSFRTLSFEDFELNSPMDLPDRL